MRLMTLTTVGDALQASKMPIGAMNDYANRRQSFN